MRRCIGAVSLLVPDYDEAIAFFTGAMDFSLEEDTDLGGGKRWVVVAPSGAAECRLILAQPTTPEQRAAMGAQAGGRVFLFLHTDDFDRDHARLTKAGVIFTETPRTETYGKVAVFTDPFGNKWDLIEPRQG